MATLRFGTYPVNAPLSWESYGDYYLIVSTAPTRAVYRFSANDVPDGLVEITFTGKNFTYNNGAPAGGQVASWTIEGVLPSGGKELAASVTGIKEPFATIWNNGETETIWSGNDKLYGTDGFDDTLRGFAGSDNIEGKGGDDFLVGGTGNDKLNGGAGIDGLLGGPGADVLTGGAGADLFFLALGDSPAGKSTRDTITDFKPSEGDKIYVYTDNVTWKGGNGLFQFDLNSDGVFETEIAIKGLKTLAYDDVEFFWRLIPLRPATARC